MDKPLVCDMCKKEAESLIMIQLLSLGDKWICPSCYIKIIS